MNLIDTILWWTCIGFISGVVALFIFVFLAFVFGFAKWGI